MRNLLRITGFLLLIFGLAACNLGTNVVEEEVPTQIIITATSIAQEVTRTSIATANPTNTVIPTQQRFVTQVVCQKHTDWLAYTVVSGDTLSRIAARGSTTVDTLVSANCLTNANLISPGQVLYVPYQVIPPTIVPTAVQGCNYYTTGAPPIYTSQTFETVLATVVSNQRYPVLGRTDFAYQILIPTGQAGWVQMVSGILEGNCDSVPVVDTTCQYYSLADALIYDSQSYQVIVGTAPANQRYIALQFNQWNYQIRLADGRLGWTQKPGGGLAGNCNGLPIAPLSYPEQGKTRTDICYFVSVNSMPSYNDQAHTEFAVTLEANTYYRTDARAGQQYRLVAGGKLPYPAWADLNTATGSVSGNCGQLPDLSIERTLNSPRATYTEPTGAFAFEYPSNWVITLQNDGLGTASTGTFSPLASYPSVMVWPTDVVWVFWSQAQDFMGNTSEAVANSIVNDILSHSHFTVSVMPEPYTTAAGMEAIYFRVEGVSAPRDNYVFEQDGKVWIFSVQGLNTYADGLVDSLRPA